MTYLQCRLEPGLEARPRRVEAEGRVLDVEGQHGLLTLLHVVDAHHLEPLEAHLSRQCGRPFITRWKSQGAHPKDCLPPGRPLRWQRWERESSTHVDDGVCDVGALHLLLGDGSFDGRRHILHLITPTLPIPRRAQCRRTAAGRVEGGRGHRCLWTGFTWSKRHGSATLLQE